MSDISNLWERSSRNDRIGIVSALAVIVVLFIVSIVWALSTNYSALFTGLETRDASAIISELERNKIEYRISDNGDSILVPDSMVHKVRIQLMGSEIPMAGTLGFELFNDSEFGMTEFAQKVNYQRALQGELTRTIMSLAEVKYVRVHLVMSDNGLFNQKDKPPSASVTLFLKGNKVPENDQILGIQRLVAASVSGLESSMVTVSDQRGQTLSKSNLDSDNLLSGISTRLLKTKDVEAYYENKILNLLDTDNGSRIKVTVNVDLNFDEILITRDGVINDKGGVGSGIVKQRESTIGSADRNSNQATSTKDIEYKLGHQVETITSAPGKIKRISVGVIINENNISITREDLHSLVAMAIGFNQERGDAIVIHDSEQVFTDISAINHDTDYIESLNQESPNLDSIDPKNDPVANLVNTINDMALRYYPFILLLFLSLMIILYIYFKQKSLNKSKRLSNYDREEMLSKIRLWLNDDSTSKKDAETNV